MLAWVYIASLRLDESVLTCSIKELLFATTPRSILQSDQGRLTSALLTSLAPQLRTAGIHAVRLLQPCLEAQYVLQMLCLRAAEPGHAAPALYTLCQLLEAYD